MAEAEHPVEPSTEKKVSDATISRLATAIEAVYSHPWRLAWRSFMQGFMTALGATVGTALLFTILIWIFQLLGGVNLIKPEVQKIQDLIIPQKYLTQDTTPSPTPTPFSTK